MMQTPQQPYRALRAAVGTAVLTLFAAAWTYGYYTGEPLGTLWDVVMLALVFAAGIAVFGRSTFTTAIDEAQDVKGSSDDGDDP